MLRSIAIVLAWQLILVGQSISRAQTPLKYQPAPPDNPLKGLVPYAGDHRKKFPHSMEFNYLPLSDLMTGPSKFDWGPLEKLLDDITSRGHQAVFRIWMEYPGHKEGIPGFLEKKGVKVTEWLNTNTDPFPRQMVRTPDYQDPRLRITLKQFIAAMGKRYDGDPRIGFITAGLIGTWGEWHTYPRNELMANKEVQTEVMDAYEQAFEKTPILLRYPAGENAWAHAPNHRRRLGYHDDSFAWATLDTGREEDNWFFVPAMKSAGPAALQKWKTEPIGGEIRPELWGQIFDDEPKHQQAQDFSECVRQTHATWLMDTGMFQKQQSDQRIRNAIRQVQRMGYEFHVSSVQVNRVDGESLIRLSIKNTGVAPFYYDWDVELATLKARDQIGKRIPVDWKITGLLPGDQPRDWTVRTQAQTFDDNTVGFAVRIVNPLPGGKPLRLANDAQRQLADGWLRLPL